MPKVETKTVTIPTEDGGIILVAVPVGPITEPSERMQQIVRAHQNPSNWKLPTTPATFLNDDDASEYAEALDFYMGGHERSYHPATCWTITSKGYYHYVGA
jgi:hypothetical protein